MTGQDPPMKNRRRWLAVVVWVATVAASIIAIAILVATRDTVVPSSWGFRGASEAFGLTAGTVGVIVATRRPDNLNGWLFCVIGALFALQALINEYVIAGALVVPGGLPFTSFLGWTLSWIWVLPLSCALIFLPLLFPTGMLVSRRWRAVAWLGAIGIVLFSLALAFESGPIQQASFIDNPFGVAGIDVKTYSALVLGPASLVFVAAVVFALSSLVLRFRDASGDARLQIKWFALATMIAGATFGVYLTLSFGSVGSSGTKALEVLVIVALMGVPTAAGMAILRYRLYDIDRIVSRTISYGVITTLLVAVFLVVNLALQAALSSITSSNAWAVAASTLLAAALFTPVRLRVQGVVDRRFDRSRYDAERLTVAFADRLRDEVDLSTLGDELDATVRRAIAPSSVALWLRGGPE
jgi:hypothetical protein